MTCISLLPGFDDRRRPGSEALLRIRVADALFPRLEEERFGKLNGHATDFLAQAIDPTNPADAVEHDRIKRTMSIEMGHAEVGRYELVRTGAILAGVVEEGHAPASDINRLAGTGFLPGPYSEPNRPAIS